MEIGSLTGLNLQVKAAVRREEAAWKEVLAASDE